MDDKERWAAVQAHDPAYDGRFFYAVTSTGIYCRPSCKSKLPKPEHIRYFETAALAEAAGFRPCKRCRPDLLAFDPAARAAEQAKAAVERHFDDREALQQALSAIGLTRRHLTRLFERRYDLSLQQYLDRVRLQRAKELLTSGTPATETAFRIGLESSASFSAFFRKHTGLSPTEYAAQQRSQAPFCLLSTPLGTVHIAGGERGISSLRFVNAAPNGAPPSEDSCLREASRQVSDYFAGQRRDFELPLDLRGTPFQQAVWAQLRQIPYGEVRTYQQIAQAVGNPKGAHAVGMACNRNPVLLLVPGHRVVGRGHRVVGYAGGIQRKEYLLDMEAKQQ